MTDKIAGAILAGGKSSRMGEDKAKLCFRGKTLLQEMENILQNVGVNRVYISQDSMIPDQIPGCGPLSGIHAILKKTSSSYSHVIFVPVDMPCLTPLALKELLSASLEHPLVRFKQYTFPFRLQVDAKWITLAEKMLYKQDNVSLRNFQECISLFELDTNFLAQSCFTNINTAKEWGNYIGGKAI